MINIIVDMIDNYITIINVTISSTTTYIITLTMITTSTNDTNSIITHEIPRRSDVVLRAARCETHDLVDQLADMIAHYIMYTIILLLLDHVRNIEISWRPGGRVQGRPRADRGGHLGRGHYC